MLLLGDNNISPEGQCQEVLNTPVLTKVNPQKIVFTIAKKNNKDKERDSTCVSISFII